MGVVGESRCGKSTPAFDVMGYLPGITRVDGRILFEGRDVAQMAASELHHLRGNRIAIVYQDPATFLNPTMRVDSQIHEVLSQHQHIGSAESRHHIVELFESVRLADP